VAPGDHRLTDVEVPPRFEARYRVRFDEAGADGLLRPSGLLRYAQDVAWRHSDAAGFDRAWYLARDRHWLVRHVRIEPRAGVGYGEELRVTTEVTGWRRVLARRHTSFESRHGGDGELVAVVETDWVLLTSAGRPATIPAQITSVFAAGWSVAAERLTLPATPPRPMAVELSVRGADVDPMGHVNNAAYVDLVDEALAALEPGQPTTGRTYRLEYVRPALPGMVLRILAWRCDVDGVACRMLASDGQELLRALVGGCRRGLGQAIERAD